MGAIFSKPDVGHEEDCLEEDPDYVAAYNELAQSSKMLLKTKYEKNKLMQLQTLQLTRERIVNIQGDFDKQDKISLIYLLYDDSLAKIALDYSRQIESEVMEDVLNYWIFHVAPRETSWKLKLLEALTLMQKYQVLHKLGFERAAVDDRFRPTDKNFSLYIPLVKKKLFRMLETFEERKINFFLEIVQNDFRAQKLVFNRYKFLEMYLLYWASIKYISNGSIENITRALRITGMNEEAEEFSQTESIGSNSLRGTIFRCFNQLKPRE